MSMTRRSFLAAGAVAMTLARPWSRALGANSDIRVALIGANGIGKTHLAGWPTIPGVRLVGICDVDENVLGARADDFEKKQNAVTRYNDLRRVFDDPQVDVVVLAIPNHWHGLGTVWACQAGKHVYVEKPCSHNIFEAQRMKEAAEKYNRIVQVGIQRRSFPHLIELFQQFRNGLIGDIQRVRAVYNSRRDSIGTVTGPQQPPKGVNHELWSGPAPTPILRPKYHYDWHWFWELGNGELGNNGPHILDLARWAIGAEELPAQVTSVGGRYVWDDCGKTPNVHMIHYDYQPAPIVMEITNLPVRPGQKASPKVDDINVGIVVEGTDGKWVGFDDGKLFDAKGKLIRETKAEHSGNTKEEFGPRQLHRKNFVAALQAGNPSLLTCPVQTGHLSTGLCHLGNISHRLGKEVSVAEAGERLSRESAVKPVWDEMVAHLSANELPVDSLQIQLGQTLNFEPRSETFVDAPAANALLRREYRQGFEVPEKV